MNLRRYRELRDKHYPAQLALNMARHYQQVETIPENVDGFDITVNQKVDPSFDISHLGRFTNQWDFGAIQVPESRFRNNLYKWFIPEYSYHEAYKEFQRRGFCRHDCDCMAKESVRRDLERASNYSSYIVEVKASKLGITLGTDYLGGCEIENDKDLRDVVFDNGMINNAVEEAKQTLSELCKHK